MFKIVFVHLLNDFSGSPKILKEAIRSSGFEPDQACLYLGGGGNGFLSDCAILTKRFCYLRFRVKICTLISFIFSQIVLFFRLTFDKSINRDTVIYINTILPFGAGIFALIRGVRVVYHIHEISIAPAPLKLLLTAVVRKSSSLNIYVSNAHKEALPIIDVPSKCIHNALDVEFLRQAAKYSYKRSHKGMFRVLMISSLREYKGLNELVLLARSTQEYSDICFDLVVNDDAQAIKNWSIDRSVPANLIIHPRTSDTVAFYRQASVVLNLSRVDQWVETFGMTILEAMAFGIPVIVPPVGGPCELVTNTEQGFLVDSRDAVELRDRLLQLYSDSDVCFRMSLAGRRRAAAFSPQAFADAIADAMAPVKREQ